MISEISGLRSWELSGSLQSAGVIGSSDFYGSVNWAMPFFAVKFLSVCFVCQQPRMLITFTNQTMCSYFLNWVQESDFIFETCVLGGFIEKQEEPIRNQHLLLWFKECAVICGSVPQACYLLPPRRKLALPHPGSKMWELKATLEVCHRILHYFENPVFLFFTFIFFFCLFVCSCFCFCFFFFLGNPFSEYTWEGIQAILKHEITLPESGSSQGQSFSSKQMCLRLYGVKSLSSPPLDKWKISVGS